MQQHHINQKQQLIIHARKPVAFFSYHAITITMAASFHKVNNGNLRLSNLC